MRWPAMRLMGLLAALVLPSLSPARVQACEFVSTKVGNGVLGRSPTSGPEITAPPNVVFVLNRARLMAAGGSPPLLTDAVTGQIILGTEAPDRVPAPADLAFLRPSAPLDSAKSYAISIDNVPDSRLVVEDPPDGVPPSVPDIAHAHVIFHDGTQGCAKSSCGDYTTLEVALTALTHDDRASDDSVSYAIYVGSTVEQARTAPRPDDLVWASTNLLLFVDPRLADENVFVSVSAVDMAGNESPRTEPVQANAAPGGCSAPSGAGRAVGGIPVLFMLALLLRRSRVGAFRRRISSSSPSLGKS